MIRLEGAWIVLIRLIYSFRRCRRGPLSNDHSEVDTHVRSSTMGQSFERSANVKTISCRKRRSSLHHKRGVLSAMARQSEDTCVASINPSASVACGRLGDEFQTRVGGCLRESQMNTSAISSIGRTPAGSRSGFRTPEVSRLMSGSRIL